MATAAALAQPSGSIVGLVTDRTTGKVAAGDTVGLISFARGMQVAATTTTDAHGHYTLPLNDSETHLVRVSHQKAAYFQPVPPGAHTVDVDVYDVAAQVDGITTEAEVLSLQTGPETGKNGELRVLDDFFVRNSSEPARTQFSSHAFEFYLPEGAKLQGTAAMGPGGAPVESSPVALPGNGHFAFVFPVRPGQTRFQVSYTLPYAGRSLDWTQREALPTTNLVVLLPKTMRFTPDGTEWQPVPANPDAQTFVRKNVEPKTEVHFSLGGEGVLPREAQDAGGNTPGTGGAAGGVATSSSMASDTRPGGGLGPPVDTPDPLNKYKGWVLGGLGVLLLAGAAWLLRGGKAGAGVGGAGATVGRAAGMAVPELRPALAQALAALEHERALGLIEEPEYRVIHDALRVALDRVVARDGVRDAVSTAP